MFEQKIDPTIQEIGQDGSKPVTNIVPEHPLIETTIIYDRQWDGDDFTIDPKLKSTLQISAANGANVEFCINSPTAGSHRIYVNFDGQGTKGEPGVQYVGTIESWITPEDDLAFIRHDHDSVDELMALFNLVEGEIRCSFIPL